MAIALQNDSDVLQRFSDVRRNGLHANDDGGDCEGGSGGDPGGGIVDRGAGGSTTVYGDPPPDPDPCLYGLFSSCGSGSSGGSVGGGTTGGKTATATSSSNPPAPNTGTAHCLGVAGAKNAGSLLLDVVGGLVAIQPEGILVLTVAQVGVSAVATFNSAMGANTSSGEGRSAVGGALLNIVGIQLAALNPVAGALGAFGSKVPVRGQLTTVAGGLNDLF